MRAIMKGLRNRMLNLATMLMTGIKEGIRSRIFTIWGVDRCMDGIVDTYGSGACNWETAKTIS